MRGLAAAIGIGVALVICSAASADSDPGNHQPLTDNARVLLDDHLWCVPGDGDLFESLCGLATTGKSRLRVITLAPTIDHSRFKICSEAPSGNRRCVPRSARKKVFEGDEFFDRIVVWYDKFAFRTAFPHRLAGQYKITWWKGGSRFGSAIRFDLPGPSAN